MSTIKANTLLHSDGSTTTQPSIPALDKRMAKAWVNFNGTGTVAIIDSYNVSSITDNSTGQTTINFDNNMADSNYAPIVGMMKNNDNGADQWTMWHAANFAKSTSNLKVGTTRGSAATDCSSASISIFGS